MKPVILRPAAAQDLENAFSWYERQVTGLGDEFLASFRRTMEAIESAPEAYQVLHRETRRVMLDRFPYGVLYRVFDDCVVVVACMHARRNPTRWKSRR